MDPRDTESTRILARSSALTPPALRAYKLVVAALLLVAAPLLADDQAGPRALLRELDSVSVDPDQVYAVRNVQIIRDRVKLYFDRGFIGLFKPVAGKVTGAVFSGQGEVLLIPPEPVEKRNLAQFIQEPILEEKFNSAYLRFTDETARDLLAAGRKPDPEDSEQPTGFAQRWASSVRSLNPDNSVRILEDLLGERAYPFFRVRLQPVNLPNFDIVVDERVAEAVSVLSVRKVGETYFADSWCSFPSQVSQSRFTALLQGSARVLSYKIETRILADRTIEGRANLLLESLSAADRVLGFDLSRWVRVTDVKDEQGLSVPILEENSDAEAQPLPRRDDWIDVVLPSPHRVGEKFRLTFTYKGNVIADVGNGVLYVGARGSWYPNRHFSELADYDMTFDYPEELTLVATGSCLEQKSSAGWTHSHWRSDGPFRVAGFNLGPYVSAERRVGKTVVEVFATQEAEAALEKRHVARGTTVLEASPRGPEGGGTIRVVPGAPAPLSPSALLEPVADDAADAIEYFEHIFGAFPYPRLAIAQIPGSFGQGWPELVYLPTLSFLPKLERSQMGLVGKSGEQIDETMVPHEIAHQWWGNLLGWQTYHDQWLSEGFASYASALSLTQGKDGDRKLRELLKAYKRDLLSKTKSGATIESGGPIWLGQRLSNSLNPEGYSNIVYKKACWVLHMLRDLLTDPATGSDEKFFQVFRGFLADYKSKEASTEDFIRYAEKHMTKASDLERNQRLDWFFQEWVYGVGIPTYQIDSSVRKLVSNKYLIQGTITQSGVSSDFEMPVPVVAVNGRDKKVRLGRVVVGDTPAHFRFTTTFKPLRVAIDEDNLLAVVK